MQTNSPTRVTRARRRPLALLAIALVFASLVGPTTPADAAPHVDAERYLFDAVNYERAAHGLPVLTFRDELLDMARNHSERMASSKRLHHNPNRDAEVGARVPDWQRNGENVGWGRSPQAIHRELMRSPEHRAIILGDYTQLAVGVTSDGERYWLTQVFLKSRSR